MRKHWAKRWLSVVMTLVMACSMMMVAKLPVRAEDGVGGFVNRCYQVTLGRSADSLGYADWTGKLSGGKADGAFVAYGFVFSNEYTKANKDNGAFVTDMYTLFLGRTPDAAGYNDWKGQLDAGTSRLDVFTGFANSREFYEICKGYGVTAGYFTDQYDINSVNGVNMFVARMYRICLGRLGDIDGQADWTAKLLRGELSGIDCANGFINSREYQSLNLSNSEYVKNLYRAFMGREYDESGYQNWVGKLNAGYTRDEVFSGFANSNEFNSICSEYGIVRGNYTPTHTHNDGTGTFGGGTGNGGSGVIVPTQPDTEGDLVWVPTKGGQKYHSNPYCSDMEDPMQLTRTHAEERGYTPCKKCYR